MAGKVKKLQRSEGVDTSPPSDLTITQSAEALVVYASDAAYVAGKGSAAADGDTYYNSTTDKARLYANGAWTDVGSGSAGGINYIVASAGVAYADAAGSAPVDGDGGLPIISVDLANTTSPLVGNSDIKISKDAADRQGEGVAWSFTIDEIFSISPKMQKISGYYSATANFSYGSFDDPAGDPSDIVFYIIDDTSGEVIQPSTFVLSGAGQFEAVWQNNAGSTDYRLCAHIATTNALAWDLQLSELSVGPQRKVIGPPMTDWVEFTPTADNWTEKTGTTAFWRRVGDSMELHYKFIADDAVAGPIAIDMPSGYAINTAKVGTYQRIGTATGQDSAVGGYVGNPYVQSSTQIKVIGNDGDDIWAAAIPFTWADPDELHIDITVPISGWSSNTLMSSEGESRAVAARARITSTTTNTEIAHNAYEQLDYNTIDYDTHGIISVDSGSSPNSPNTNWSCTIPVAGHYHIEASTGFASTNFNASSEMIGVTIKSNGGIIKYNQVLSGAASSSWNVVTATTDYKFNSGDVITIEGLQQSGGALNLATWTSASIFSIHRIADPSAIAATEVVAMHAQINNGAVTTCTDTSTTQDFNLVDYDTHNMTTTGASWKWTAPIMGFYHISLGYQLVANTYAVNNQLIVNIQKNGTAEIIMRDRADTTSSTQLFVMGSADIKMEAGDYISVQAKHNDTGINVNIDDGDNRRNWISIHRIGGVL